MRARRILYWVAIAVLVAIMIGCAGAIAYKFITDAKEQNIYDELLSSMPDRDPSMTLPTRDPNAPTISIVPTDPNAPTTSRPRPVIPESEILFPYRSLYTINNDMVGFLEIPGTNIKWSSPPIRPTIICAAISISAAPPAVPFMFGKPAM